MHSPLFYIVVLTPYYVILSYLLWALFTKKKFFATTLLGLTFSSAPLLFLFLNSNVGFGNFNIGYTIGMYSSIVITVPLAIFGIYLGNKIKISYVYVLSVLAILFNFSVVKAYHYVLEKNADVLKREVLFDCQKLPFHCAIRDNDLTLLSNLIPQGFDIESRDVISRTALWYGAKNLAAVKILLENGANPDSVNIYGETLLAHALVLSPKPNMELAQLLMKHGAQINRSIGFRKKISILNMAIVNENIDAIKFALENGANPKLDDGYRKTPCQRLQKLKNSQNLNIEKYCL